MSNEHNNAVPQGWKSVLIPTEWTIGPNLFKDWCSQWFGPDSDDDHLMRAAHALLGLSAAPAAPSQPVTLTDEWLLERFKHHPNWELSTSNDPECDPSVFWRVHKVEGSRSYREWFLIGEGESPRAAIIAALRKKEQTK